MIRIGKILDTIIEKSGIRQIKLTGLGSVDHKEVYHVQPFGVNSRPGDGKKVVYADTAKDGDNIALGVIQIKNDIEKGETRIFSENESGAVVFELILKNDGTAEIGGSSDFAVKYNELNTGLSNQDSAINAELAKIQTAITGLGGAYARIPISTNISSAKVDNIKLP